MLALFGMPPQELLFSFWRLVSVGDQLVRKLEPEDLLICLEIFNADLVALGAAGTSGPGHAKLGFLQTILHTHDVSGRDRHPKAG